MKNITLVSTYPPRHCGIAEYTFDLSHALANRSNEYGIGIVSFKDGQSSGRRTESRDGVRVIRAFEKSTGGRKAAELILTESKPDLIHLQSTTFLYGRLFATFPKYIPRGMPFVVTAHDVPHYRQFHMYPFVHTAYQRADIIITLSRQVAGELSKFHRVPPQRISVLHHGVDTSVFNPKVSGGPFREKYGLSESDFVIMLFGFLGRGKGIADLLKAFLMLRERRPEAKIRLVLAGEAKDDPRYDRQVKSLVNSYGIDDVVTITGFVPRDEIPSTLAAADVLVYPYLGSSQSGPLHLSLAMGKPIVVTDIPSFRELIQDHVNGLIIPMSNPEMLFQRIDELYKDENLRIRLGAEARETAVEHLSWETNALDHLQLYSKAMGPVG